MKNNPIVTNDNKSEIKNIFPMMNREFYSPNRKENLTYITKNFDYGSIRIINRKLIQMILPKGLKILKRFVGSISLRYANGDYFIVEVFSDSISIKKLDIDKSIKSEDIIFDNLIEFSNVKKSRDFISNTILIEKEELVVFDFESSEWLSFENTLISNLRTLRYLAVINNEVVYSIIFHDKNVIKSYINEFCIEQFSITQKRDEKITILSLTSNKIIYLVETIKKNIVVLLNVTNKVSLQLSGVVRFFYKGSNNSQQILCTSEPFSNFNLYKLSPENKLVSFFTEVYKSERGDCRLIERNLNNKKTSIAWYNIKNKKSDTPLVIHLHGGPHDYWRPCHNYYLEELFRQGIEIFVPNYTGSSVSKRDLFGEYYQWGETEIIEILDLIQQNNERKIFLSGESYGAYMIWKIIKNYFVKVEGCVLISPFYSINSLYNSSGSIVKRTLLNHNKRKFNFSEKAMVDGNKKKQVNSDILLFHGVNDNVIPISESKKILTYLKNYITCNGRVETEFLKNMGHSISGVEKKITSKVLTMISTH